MNDISTITNPLSGVNIFFSNDAEETVVVFNEEIGDTSDYAELISLLHLAEFRSRFTFILKNFGGDVDTATLLINTMRTSLAKIHCIVSGSVASAGSLVALAGDTLTVNDFVSLMFHDYSLTVSDKSYDIKQQSLVFDHCYRTLLDDICTPFLTQAEIKKILSGQDIYIWSPYDIQTRVKRHNNARSR